MKKCVFFTPFGILFGQIVCKDGMLVDPAKITVIVDLPTPTIVKQLRVKLGHRGYHRKFIRGYTMIFTPMHKLLKKDTHFEWIDEC